MRVDCVEFEQKIKGPKVKPIQNWFMDSHFYTIALSNHELIIKYDQKNDILTTNFVKIVDFFSYAHLQLSSFCATSEGMLSFKRNFIFITIMYELYTNCNASG